MKGTKSMKRLMMAGACALAMLSGAGNASAGEPMVTRFAGMTCQYLEGDLQREPKVIRDGAMIGFWLGLIGAIDEQHPRLADAASQIDSDRFGELVDAECAQHPDLPIPRAEIRAMGDLKATVE
jgi:hypothetical protein